MDITSVDLELEIGFNVHIQRKLLKHTFVVGASSDLAQPFRPIQKKKEKKKRKKKRKKRKWVVRRVGYLAMTFALK